MARVLVPLPDRDFDLTEVSAPWHLLREKGHTVVFATEAGAVAAGDPLLIDGPLFGQLGAERDIVALYRRLEADAAFRAPIRWDQIVVEDYAAMLLPGGHAPGMKQYLAGAVLHDKVRAFWALKRPVAAICHGVLVLARAGVLNGRTTTCLPKYMEQVAYGLTGWKLGKYYRTYPAYVEDEVREALGAGGTFERGPFTLIRKGTATDDRHGFVVVDDNYLSARWPGDAWKLGRMLEERLQGSNGSPSL
jgi:putative intracellular protease/amidase